MRCITFGSMIAILSAGAATPAAAPEPTTVVVGTVRAALTREPIAGATVFAELGGDSVRTDSAGGFTLRVRRGASLIGFRGEGFLSFEFPMLRMTTDTLFADVELRTDPLGPAAYVDGTHVPYLCVVRDAPDRFVVVHSCDATRYRQPEYRRQIIKHNPWNPYFGPAGDKGGVLIATKEVT